MYCVRGSLLTPQSLLLYTMDRTARSHKRWPQYGSDAPPFPSGSREYRKWREGVLRQARRQCVQNWPEFFAKAKREAAINPPKLTVGVRLKSGLFGGSSTPEYKAWYYQTLKAARASGTNDWPAFFAKAREVEMKRQGLAVNQGRNSPCSMQVHVKPNNVVPLNPILSLPPDFDGPLRFEF